MILWLLYIFCKLFLVLCHDFQWELQHMKSKTTSDIQTLAVLNMIKRIVPDHADRFSVTVNGKLTPDNKEFFHIQRLPNNTVNLVGSTGVSVAGGFHYYLKYYCNSHISWEFSRIDIPDKLPNVNITITLNDRFRYYQNVCTTSYSFVWWNWSDWEKHIDWMSLNSFNLVLAFHGQEAIWNKIYNKLNLTQAEIDEHFGGPAFLSWSRMGNIRGWGGPLSQSWHERTVSLGKLILNRMREFGIITILPAFAGHVPRAFARLYPSANMVEVKSWNKFNTSYCCPYLLDPSDPLFQNIGKIFLDEMIQEFGTDHVYSSDTFNEMAPFTTNETYIKLIGQSIYESMANVDEKAIWIMQNWLFVHETIYWTEKRAEALLTSVPRGKMVVLDLQSEQFPQYGRFNSYFGQPFIWCMLHDFGGTLGMFGSSTIINKRPFQARSEQNSTMIGIGLTPEGINQNYVIYDLMTEMAWRTTSTNLTQWFINYARRRYGQHNVNAETAWLTLLNTVYDFEGLELIRGKYVITRSPSTKIETRYWYNTCDVFEAWGNFMDAADILKDSYGYRHDMVDLTRQVLQLTGDEIYNHLIYSFKNKYSNNFSNSANEFLNLLDDLELILATNEAFLLGRWLNAAKNASINEKDKILFEYNARNQITLWGPTGEIKDYANKQWSGIVSHYFQPRWSKFLKEMNDSLFQNVPFKEKAVKKIIFENIERNFTFDRTEFPEIATGDTIKVAQDIFNRWWPKIHCRNAREVSSLDNNDMEMEKIYVNLV